MNIRKIFFVPAICGMLALPFGAYGGNPDSQAAAAFRNAVDNAGLIPGDDDKTPAAGASENEKLHRAENMIQQFQLSL